MNLFLFVCPQLLLFGDDFLTSVYAAIWDLNGVIIDDMPIHFESYREVLGPLGYDLKMDEYNALCVGASMVQVFGKIMPLLPKPISIESAIEQKLNAYFRLAEGRMVMLPGVGELIRGLARIGFVQAIASGGTGREIEVILKSFGVDQYFTASVGCEDVTKGKPDPEPFMTAAQRLGAEPANCVIFEDGEFGIRAAKSCGMKAVGITNTLPANELAQADIVVDSLEQVTPDTIADLLQ